MTPKEKAFHLHFKFIRDVIADDKKAKQCALIAVDEILKVFNVVCSNHPSFDNGIDKTKFYWRRVRNEIEKL